jgi:hypothetical protein
VSRDGGDGGDGADRGGAAGPRSAAEAHGPAAGVPAPALGVLLLAGKNANVPGCMACAASFPYPVVYRVVEGSRPPASPAAAEELAPLYVAAARELALQGVAAIADNCNGLMALLQDRLAAAVPVPVVTSALLAVPVLSRLLPGRRLGILAFNRAALSEEVYNACGWSGREVPLAVGEVAASSSWQEFLRTKEISEELRPRLEADLLAVAREMAAAHPDLAAFVSECTLLPPACQAVRAALGLPVFDVLNVLDLVLAGRRRPASMPAGPAFQSVPQ